MAFNAQGDYVIIFGIEPTAPTSKRKCYLLVFLSLRVREINQQKAKTSEIDFSEFQISNVFLVKLRSSDVFFTLVLK